MRDNAKSVIQALDLPAEFTLVTNDDYDEALDRWKVLVVQARRDGATEREVVLNGCKAWLLKRKRLNCG